MGWLFWDRIIRIILSMVVGAWCARYLGPSNYGELSYVLAYIVFFQSAARLGLDSIVIREIALKPDESGIILGTVLWCRVCISVFLAILSILLMILINPDEIISQTLTTILSLTILLQCADVFDLWFQSQSKNKPIVIAKTVAYLISSIVKVLLIVTKASLIWFALAWLIESAIGAIALILTFSKYKVRLNFSLQKAKVLLHEAWPYLLSGLGIIIYMRIDQIMLKSMAGSAEVGIYTAGIAPSEAWYFIAGVLLVALSPLTANKKSLSYDEYHNFLSHIFSLLWIIGFAITLFILIFSEWIIFILFGLNYSRSSTVLSIHILTVIPVFLGVASNLWLTNEKRGDLGVKQTAAGAAINFLMNLYLIPRYGAAGAAISTVIAQLVSTIGINYFYAKELFRLQILSFFKIRKIICTAIKG